MAPNSQTQLPVRFSLSTARKIQHFVLFVKSPSFASPSISWKMRRDTVWSGCDSFPLGARQLRDAVKSPGREVRREENLKSFQKIVGPSVESSISRLILFLPDLLAYTQLWLRRLDFIKSFVVLSASLYQMLSYFKQKSCFPDKNVIVRSLERLLWLSLTGHWKREVESQKFCMSANLSPDDAFVGNWTRMSHAKMSLQTTETMLRSDFDFRTKHQFF